MLEWRCGAGRAVVMIAALAMAQQVRAEVWHTPAAGTELRTDLMDALRPFAVWSLGRPVLFVVHDLRIADDVAFANVTAQRPDGAVIDLRATPGVQRGEMDPEFMDGATLQALFVRSGKTWVAVHHAIGATDAWYTDPDFCPDFRAVIPEACGGN